MFIVPSCSQKVLKMFWWFQKGTLVGLAGLMALMGLVGLFTSWVSWVSCVEWVLLVLWVWLVGWVWSGGPYRSCESCGSGFEDWPFGSCGMLMLMMMILEGELGFEAKFRTRSGCGFIISNFISIFPSTLFSRRNVISVMKKKKKKRRTKTLYPSFH